MALGMPALFTPQLKRLLTDAGVGFAAESVVARFFVVQYWCAGIALAQMVAEWFYNGRRLWRLNFGLALCVLALDLAGGLWAQPKMVLLHKLKYFGHTLEQQEQAARTFAAWHTTSEAVNLLVIIGLIWFLWRVSTEPEPERFVSFSKMRG